LDAIYNMYVNGCGGMESITVLTESSDNKTRNVVVYLIKFFCAFCWFREQSGLWFFRKYGYLTIHERNRQRTAQTARSNAMPITCTTKEAAHKLNTQTNAAGRKGQGDGARVYVTNITFHRLSAESIFASALIWPF